MIGQFWNEDDGRGARAFHGHSVRNDDHDNDRDCGSSRGQGLGCIFPMDRSGSGDRGIGTSAFAGSVGYAAVGC